MLVLVALGGNARSGAEKLEGQSGSGEIAGDDSGSASGACCWRRSDSRAA